MQLRNLCIQFVEFEECLLHIGGLQLLAAGGLRLLAEGLLGFGLWRGYGCSRWRGCSRWSRRRWSHRRCLCRHCSRWGCGCLRWGCRLWRRNCWWQGCKYINGLNFARLPMFTVRSKKISYQICYIKYFATSMLLF